MAKSEQLGDIVIDRIVESVATFFHPRSFFDEALPEAAVTQCVEMALTYHRRKRRQRG